MAKKGNESGGKGILIGITIIILFLGLLGTGFLQDLLKPASKKTTRELAMSCITHANLALHIHPELEIVVSGEKQELPANIGVDPLCMKTLHTHDATGVIHIEGPEPRDFTLSDFFAVWEKPFSKDQILDYKADDTHEIVMTVGEQPSNAFEALVLKDKEKIRIEYRERQ